MKKSILSVVIANDQARTSLNTLLAFSAQRSKENAVFGVANRTLTSTDAISLYNDLGDKDSAAIVEIIIKNIHDAVMHSPTLSQQQKAEILRRINNTPSTSFSFCLVFSIFFGGFLWLNSLLDAVNKQDQYNLLLLSIFSIIEVAMCCMAEAESKVPITESEEKFLEWLADVERGINYIKLSSLTVTKPEQPAVPTATVVYDEETPHAVKRIACTAS